MEKIKSSRNKTITITESEKEYLSNKVIKNIENIMEASSLENRIILGDLFSIHNFLPSNFVDLLILDPPYNINKNFGKIEFKKSSISNYLEYFENIICSLIHTLKENATIYVCCDWYSSASIHLVLDKYFNVQNRITWQREKGRGAKSNWKNSHEDIWFCTKSKKFTFNVDDVKLRRRVIAPYKENGKPKDWIETKSGNFRDTYPSNFWDDITIPYWSMSENTEHPTQKPEKLLAKLILASSNEDDLVFDPFLGSGTTAVVARKLNRKYLGIDIDEKYSALALKRLLNIKDNKIQGYEDSVFWQRNTLNSINKKNIYTEN